MNAQHFLELNIVEPAEADIVEDQQDFLPTLSSEDMMKLGLIAQVKEDHSSLPANRKRRISQADVLEEQHKALKLQQEMLELKKTKLRMEILLISKKLGEEGKENIPISMQDIFYEHFILILGFYISLQCFVKCFRFYINFKHIFSYTKSCLSQLWK